MNSWVLVNVVLNLFTLINCIIACSLCSAMFLLIIGYHRHSRSVPLLLASYTGLTLFISSLMLASMSLTSLFGFFGIFLDQTDENSWCYWRGFFIHAFLCTLYDSYVLQAIYRLCRVAFYRVAMLHRFSLYGCFIPFGFAFGLMSISPIIVHRDIVYLPSEFYCQTPFTNLLMINYVALRLFLLPIILITLIYWCLLRSVHRSNSSFRQHHRSCRDVIVIRRLLLMLLVLILLGLPSVICLSVYIVTGHLFILSYRIGWLSVSFSLVFLVTMLLQRTLVIRNTVKELCCHREREQSAMKSSNV